MNAIVMMTSALPKLARAASASGDTVKTAVNPMRAAPRFVVSQ